MILGRVLVAERGPMAGYLIRSLKRLGMETVAIAPDPVEPVSYNEAADFYVQLLGGQEGFQEALVEVAVDAGCDAVHPGYTALAKMPILRSSWALHEWVLLGHSQRSLMPLQTGGQCGNGRPVRHSGSARQCAIGASRGHPRGGPTTGAARVAERRDRQAPGLLGNAGNGGAGRWDTPLVASGSRMA